MKPITEYGFVEKRKGGDRRMQPNSIVFGQALLMAMVFVTGLAVGYYWAAESAANLILNR
jgi:hypothetical protein